MITNLLGLFQIGKACTELFLLQKEKMQKLRSAIVTIS